MGHFYRYIRGDRAVIVFGKRAGVLGVVDSAVFQRILDYPDDYPPGYRVILVDDAVVAVRWNQVKGV